MAAVKGKQPVKGAKQIKEENQQTYDYYVKLVCAAYGLYGTIYLIFNGLSTPGWLELTLLCASLAVVFLCMKTFSSMQSSNLNLNMSSGVAEHVKDVLLVTVGCQFLSSFSLYCWLIWLIVPMVAFYQLWVRILAPWIFAEAPPEMTEKQKRKIERRRR